MGIQKPRNNPSHRNLTTNESEPKMQIQVRGNMKEGFIACAVTEKAEIFINTYSNPLEAIAELSERIFRGSAQISVMFHQEDEQDEWQVLDEVPPNQANERKAK